jgi:predicted protein tyrosine phosphatase
LSVCVCNLNEMPRHVAALRPSHLVSLVAPDEQPETPAGFARGRHIRIAIDDITEPREGHILPEREHVEAVIALASEWDAEAPLLLHCVAGISRSMAAALIILAARAPSREVEAALEMRKRAPHAHPNHRMITLADAVLGCEGRLIAARDAMGEGEPALEGPLVRLPLL